MPTIQRGDATIYYEERGSGPPLLLLAPGGLNSTVDFWGRMPLNPLEAFSNDFRVIAMDQRNAGRSSGPLDTSDPWHMYADDQLAVLDHLGVDQATVIGCCIGCSFVFQLLEQAPGRLPGLVAEERLARGLNREFGIKVLLEVHRVQHDGLRRALLHRRLKTDACRDRVR